MPLFLSQELLKCHHIHPGHNFQDVDPLLQTKEEGEGLGMDLSNTDLFNSKFKYSYIEMFKKVKVYYNFTIPKLIKPKKRLYHEQLLWKEKQLTFGCEEDWRSRGDI